MKCVSIPVMGCKERALPAKTTLCDGIVNAINADSFNEGGIVLDSIRLVVTLGKNGQGHIIPQYFLLLLAKYRNHTAGL